MSTLFGILWAVSLLKVQMFDGGRADEMLGLVVSLLLALWGARYKQG